MNTSPTSTLSFVLLLIFSCSWAALGYGRREFLQCLSQKSHNYSSFSNVVYTPANSLYPSILQFSIQNLRFESDSTPKPQVIIIPRHESQIPPVIYCAKQNGLEIRTRSGGHDFEGLSYVSQVLFVIIDMINLSEVTVDADEKTAWVEAGATVGSLYYRIAEKSPIMGFPAGDCPTVGVGGQFSGGGIGTMPRKYGLAADNVIDARIVDVNGRILDRKSMGEDLFWAIRGGGGGSFGVIVSWKVKLVDVPETVTVFKIDRTLEQNATQLVHRWQYIAPKLNKDLFIGIVITRQNSTINASFYSLFLGGIKRLLSIMKKSFPELGLEREDCAEVSWIQAVVYMAGYSINSSPRVLLNRSNLYMGYFKGKSNYVQTPIPESGFEGLWKELYKAEGARAEIQMVPYGGRMAEIGDSAIPFPHRADNLYGTGQLVYWEEGENRDSHKYVSWIRRLESYMTPYVSKGAYVNARDLDLGVNDIDTEGEESYAQASIWGKRYFMNNFNRLVQIKTVVDPENFFKNEQSIPPLPSRLAE